MLVTIATVLPHSRRSASSLRRLKYAELPFLRRGSARHAVCTRCQIDYGFDNTSKE